MMARTPAQNPPKASSGSSVASLALIHSSATIHSSLLAFFFHAFLSQLALKVLRCPVFEEVYYFVGLICHDDLNLLADEGSLKAGNACLASDSSAMRCHVAEVILASQHQTVATAMQPLIEAVEKTWAS